MTVAVTAAAAVAVMCVLSAAAGFLLCFYLSGRERRISKAAVARQSELELEQVLKSREELRSIAMYDGTVQ